MSNFLKRSITGLLFVFVILGAIVTAQWLADILFLVFTVVGINEFLKISGIKLDKSTRYIAIFSGALLYIILAMIGLGYLEKSMVIYIIPLFFLLIAVNMFLKHESPLLYVSLVLFSSVYIAVPFALLGFLYDVEFFAEVGAYHVLLAFFAFIWIYDTAAYLAGKAFGKHKMWEKVSPGKTWEGFIGGFIFNILAGFIWQVFFPAPVFMFWVYFSVIIVAFGTIGDLFESVIKRKAGVKDSGNFFPGHGGVLDRFDSTLLAVPFIYGFIQLFV